MTKKQLHTQCDDACWLQFPLFRTEKGEFMANKAVFLDRDQTIIEDPGYISDPAQVKLLPGAEVAIKSLAQGGYKIVVVTNQSGIARGMLNEETLEQVHQELRRQLGQSGAAIDAIYFCPFHPEGSVEAYAKESEHRKPAPGMLLLAAAEMDLDLSQSWMIGDGVRDVEAGQRAGCHTIRLQSPAQAKEAAGEGEEIQADYTVRNLVDAARIILRGSAEPGSAKGAKAAAKNVAKKEASQPPAVTPPAITLPGSDDKDCGSSCGCSGHAEVECHQAPAADNGPMGGDDVRALTQIEISREMLAQLRKLACGQGGCSISKFFSGLLLTLAVVMLICGAYSGLLGSQYDRATVEILASASLGILAMTLYAMQRG